MCKPQGKTTAMWAALCAPVGDTPCTTYKQLSSVCSQEAEPLSHWTPRVTHHWLRAPLPPTALLVSRTHNCCESLKCIYRARTDNTRRFIYVSPADVADHSGREVWGVNCLRSLERWDRGFQSHSRNGCLCAFVLCVGSGLATGWSPVQGVLPTVYIRKKLNSVALVRKQTIPTERPPLVGEVSAKLWG
jgi:hypothetical protein